MRERTSIHPFDNFRKNIELASTRLSAKETINYILYVIGQ